jgi:hypothetical protein
MVLRRIFGPKRDEVAGGRRKLHNEELHDLYFSPSIIRIVKSWRRWAGRVERMGKRNAYRFQLHDLGKEPSSWCPIDRAEWAPETIWTMGRGEIACLYLDSNSDPLAVQSVASRYTGSLQHRQYIFLIYVTGVKADGTRS